MRGLRGGEGLESFENLHHLTWISQPESVKMKISVTGISSTGTVVAAASKPSERFSAAMTRKRKLRRQLQKERNGHILLELIVNRGDGGTPRENLSDEEGAEGVPKMGPRGGPKTGSTFGPKTGAARSVHPQWVDIRGGPKSELENGPYFGSFFRTKSGRIGSIGQKACIITLTKA